MPTETGFPWFITLFLIMWFGINASLSLISGWFQLSRKFPCSKKFQAKESFRLTSLSLGPRLVPVSYGNTVFVSINEYGIRISVLFLFRLLTSPILIPWDNINSAKRERYILVNSTLLNISSVRLLYE